MDVCFMCTKDYHCVPVDDRIVSEVEYLIPEITITKLGIPLRICYVCERALDAFGKFKHSSVESSRRLESSIRARGAPGPPLHTGRAPVVGHNDTFDTQPEKIEAVYIKEEPVEETWPECHPHINSASLNPALRVDRTSPDTNRALPNPQNQQNQLKSQTSSRIDFFTDFDNTENVSIKEELLKDTLQGQELYKNVKKYVCKADYAESNTMSDNKDNESEHKTEEENSRADTREEVWEKSSAEPEEMVVKENIKNYSKSNQIDTKKRTLCNKNLKTTCRSEHRSKINNKLFIRKANLSRHKKKVQGRIKHLPCFLCKETFIHKYNLNRHIELHNGIKNFQCSICKKRFLKKYNLRQHLNTHNGQKDVRGNTNTKTFTSETELKSRSTEQESIRVNKAWPCSVCHRICKYKSELEQHMKIHSEFKEFQCEICRKSFNRKFNLLRHMNVHSGVKDFHCNICSRSFKWSSTLRHHMKKEHQSDVCSKSFFQESNLSDIYDKSFSSECRLPGKIEEVYIKEEPVEETRPECHPHINSASLNPALRVDRTSPHVQLRALHTDISVKEEQLEETPQDQKLYNNIKENICKEEYVESNTMSDDKDKRQHKTEEENSRADTREEVWEKSSAEPEEIVVKETHKNYSKNNQIEKKKTTLCKKNFKKMHKKEHRSNISKKIFIRKTNISRLKKKVQGRIKHLPCILCKQTFIHKYDLNRHIALHNGIKNFQCFICKKRVLRKHNLRQHLNNHNRHKNFRGNTSTKTFTSETELKSHSIEQERIRVNNAWPCSVCHKIFTYKSKLDRHIKIHSEFKEFHCEICSKSFTQKSHLSAHMKVHSGVKDFHCKVCNKSFRWRSNLSSHMNTHFATKEQKSVICSKNTQEFNMCDVCDKSFPSKFSLLRHMKLHSGKKDYQCNVCSKPFRQKSHLKRHLEVHSGVKVHQCNVCNKLYKRKSFLIDHMKTHIKTGCDT